ncbi:hypothetical protein niasHS_013518 [Heterodera schachtii]|uniref:Mediator of RNA polymerase II transcription subunit 27 n=1 Tax=Heterodera schachtii TaxID=97005 RepID=A0ABD2IE16_HETSC
MVESGTDTQMLQLCNSIEKCLQHLRALKNHVIGAHNLLSEKMALATRTEEPSQIDFESVKYVLEKAGVQIADEYNKIEYEAKNLPSQTPLALMVNKLNNFLLDCSTNQDSAGTLYSNTRSVFDWSDSTASFVNYTYEFLKMANASCLTQQRNRKLTLLNQFLARQEPNTSAASIPTEPSSYMLQRKFEQTLSNFAQNFSAKIQTEPQVGFRLVLNHIEQSALSSVIEVKFMFLSLPRSNYKPTEKSGPSVCLLKALLLVNNGLIEYVHFVAPHEEWHFSQMPRFGTKKQVDLSVPSRYELYHKFTAFGNVVTNFLANNPNVSFKVFQLFFSSLSRLYTINFQCARCGKRLREFSPMIATEQKNCLHLSCK